VKAVEKASCAEEKRDEIIGNLKVAENSLSSFIVRRLKLLEIPNEVKDVSPSNDSDKGKYLARRSSDD